MGSLFIPDKLREKIKKVTDQLELRRKQGLGLGKRKDYRLDKQEVWDTVKKQVRTFKTTLLVPASNLSFPFSPAVGFSLHSQARWPKR